MRSVWCRYRQRTRLYRPLLQYRPQIDYVGICCFAGLCLCGRRRGRCGRSFLELYLMVSDRSTCVLVLEQYTDAPSNRLHPPLQGRRGRYSHCRVRIYLAVDDLDAPVVICSELPNNPGGSITNSAEVIAAGVIRANELPTPLVWIEHWPEESAEGQESFELVVFSSYEVTERAPYLQQRSELLT